MECVEIGIKKFDVKYTEDLIEVVNKYILENDIKNIINLEIKTYFSCVVGTLIYYK